MYIVLHVHLLIYHQFANKTLTSEEFKEFFMRHFEAQENVREALKQIDWQVGLGI